MVKKRINSKKSKLRGGVKTSLVVKAMSKYLNPKSRSDLSFQDQIKFENALANARQRLPTLSRNDMYATLKRGRANKPPPEFLDVTKSSEWLHKDGGRRKSRRIKRRTVSRRKSQRRLTKFSKKSKSRKRR